MSVSRLIRAVEGVGRVPVSLDDVVHRVRGLVPDERVSVIAVDIDPSLLRGLCVTLREDDGAMLTRIKHSRILFSSQMSLPEQRLVCCKELIHVLDADPVRTSSHGQILPLAERMAHGHTNNLKGPDDVKAFVDAMAKWQALALLFPYGFYEQIYPHFKAGRVSNTAIASYVGLPQVYVDVVLTDTWDLIRTTVLAFA